MNQVRPWFSAALSRGLIEAAPPSRYRLQVVEFSAALSRGLIEASGAVRTPGAAEAVFRGFKPRPH